MHVIFMVDRRSIHSDALKPDDKDDNDGKVAGW